PNLHPHLSIAVVNKPGLGKDFTYHLGYDNSVWYPVTSGGTLIWQSVGNWGWRGQTDAAVGYVIYKATPLSCFSQEDNRWESYTNYYFTTYVDEYGTTHNLGTIAVSDKSVQTTCTGGTIYQTQVSSTDGSGLTITVTATPSATVVKTDGSVVKPPLFIGASAATVTDRNGNKITVDTSGHFYDTLSSTTPTLTVAGSGTPSS